MSSTSTTTLQQQAFSQLHLQHVDDPITLATLDDASPQEESFTNQDQAPDNATEAIPDGGYGWVVGAASSLLLF